MTPNGFPHTIRPLRATGGATEMVRENLNERERGGALATLAQPNLFTAKIRTGFRALRGV